VLVQKTSQVTDSAYTVNNNGDDAREVLVEHVRRPNAELESETKPAETTATAYRFRMAVKPHESADLHVRERALLSETVRIDPEEDRSAFLIAVGKITPSVEEKLRPLIDAETALSSLNAKIEEIERKEKTLSADEDRARANLTALKGNDAAKRFVEELNSAEDQLQAARKQVADLEQQKIAAVEKLNSLIAGLSFDWDVKTD
jgi:chromosome segregation ATPase